MAANKAVFNQTGVYFKESSLGLEGLGVVASHSEPSTRPLHHGGSDETVISKWKTQTDSLFYSGIPTMVWLLPPGNKGGVYRLVTAEVMNRLSINDNYRFHYSPEAFDLWYSSIALVYRHNNVKRVYRLEPWDEEYIHRDYGTPTTTVADVLEVYRISQKMGTTELSDAILDDIAKTLLQEDALVAKHRAGDATLQDCAFAVR